MTLALPAEVMRPAGVLRLILCVALWAAGCSSPKVAHGTNSTDAGACLATESPCPAAEPAVGSPCPTRSLQCEYGGTPERTCIRLLECSDSADGGLVWSGTTEPPCGDQPAACPATVSAAIDQGCGPQGTACSYPEGFCVCQPCESDPIDAGSAVWACSLWRYVGSGCAGPRPLLGDACCDVGAYCGYSGCCGAVSLGPNMKCLDGAWSPQPDDCEGLFCPAFFCPGATP
jgi:hypothetical protein